MRRRALVVAVVVASLGVAPGADAATLRIAGATDTARVRVGQLVTFDWVITDPDPATVVDGFRVDHGDGRATTIVAGRRPAVCTEAAESPVGLRREIMTAHRFRAAGTYRVVAIVDATQRLCGVAVSASERARTAVRVLVVN